MKQVAILSMDSLENFEAYDYLLDEPLKQLGWQTHLISWRAQNVDWNQFDAVVIRTPWDYQEDAQAFLTVLADIEASNTHLENSLNIVKWNIDKHYLQQLEQQGVAIVPSLFEHHFTADKLPKYFHHFDVEQIVIKPTISANADNTFWLKQTDTQPVEQLTQIFAGQDYIVQPFLSSVVSEGEFSLFYFNGQYSHAILKTPKQDDFRVQEEHGGRLTSITPEAELTRVAQQALTALPEQCLYARLDFVRYQQSFVLMEAELIEPSLYFNMDADSPKRFAKAFVDKMANSRSR